MPRVVGDDIFSRKTMGVVFSAPGVVSSSIEQGGLHTSLKKSSMYCGGGELYFSQTFGGCLKAWGVRGFS